MFEGLRPGSVIISTNLTLVGGDGEFAKPAQVNSGQNTVVDLQIKRSDAAINGKVIPFDPSMTYTVTATYSVEGENPDIYVADLTPDGSFLFSDMPYGRFHITVEARKYVNRWTTQRQALRAVVRTHPGEIERHDFYFSNELAAEGIVSNVGYDEPLNVLANKALRLDNLSPRALQEFRESPYTHYAFVDVDGGFRFDDLPPGTYQIVAEGGSNRYGLATILVAPRPSYSSTDPQPFEPFELWLEDN